MTLSTYFKTRKIVATDWISQAEAARLRGVSRQAISRLVKKGRLRILHIGGFDLLNRAEVQAFKPLVAGRPRKKKRNG